jgi:hypothetical protein
MFEPSNIICLISWFIFFLHSFCMLYHTLISSYFVRLPRGLAVPATFSPYSNRRPFNANGRRLNRLLSWVALSSILQCYSHAEVYSSSQYTYIHKSVLKSRAYYWLKPSVQRREFSFEGTQILAEMGGRPEVWELGCLRDWHFLF